MAFQEKPCQWTQRIHSPPSNPASPAASCPSSRSCPCLLSSLTLRAPWPAQPAEILPENTLEQGTGSSPAGALPRRMMRIPPSWERRYLAAPGSWPMRMQGRTVISRKMAGRPSTEAAIISARQAWTYPVGKARDGEFVIGIKGDFGQKLLFD